MSSVATVSRLLPSVVNAPPGSTSSRRTWPFCEFCAFLRCFSGKREKRSGVHRQRLVAVDTAGECQDSLHGALVLPLIEPGALDRPGPGHGPSLPRLAHADGFPFSRSAASRAGRKCRGCARGPTTTAARAAVLISRACSAGV